MMTSNNNVANYEPAMHDLFLASAHKKSNWDKDERYKLMTLILKSNRTIDPFKFLDKCNIMIPEMLLLLEDVKVITQEQIFDYVANTYVDENKFEFFLKLIKKSFFSPHPDAFLHKV
jgi:hypothetical protein